LTRFRCAVCAAAAGVGQRDDTRAPRWCSRCWGSGWRRARRSRRDAPQDAAAAASNATPAHQRVSLAAAAGCLCARRCSVATATSTTTPLGAS
jgi:hypothetical protein